jgi:hypothetical protein
MESLPIFHQPTFSFDLIQRELCGSIFCVGLLIAHDPVLYQIGCTLLRQTRSQLLQVSCGESSHLALAKEISTVYRQEHNIFGGFRHTTGNVLIFQTPYVICSCWFLTKHVRLLVEFSGMYLADRTAMELSDIFHGSLVTLSRRLGLFEMTYNNMRAASVSSDGLESQNSVQHESAKR